MKVNEHLSVLFLLEKSKASADGSTPIWVRLTIDGARAEFSLGQKIQRDYWDQKNENVNLDACPNKKEAMLLYSRVTQTLNDLKTHFFFLSQQYDRVTPDLLKRSYKGLLAEEKKKEQEPAIQQERTLLQVLNYKYSKFATLVKAGQRSPNTLRRWKVTKRKLRAFLNFKFKAWDVFLSNFSLGHADDFLLFLLTKHGIQENTAMKYLKNTKELLEIAENKEWRAKNPWSGFKIKYDQPERVCLSMADIIKIYQKKLIQRLDHVRNIFLFACFTGYSFQEIHDLDPDTIFVGIDGKRWVKIDRKKTGNPECLPLLPIPAAVVDRYADDPYCRANNRLLPVKSYQHYNGYLKELADICEINLELSTHIARHTFATTICLDNGVPIATVSRMLGHKSIRTTQIYARVSKRNISINMSLLEQKLFAPNGQLKVVEAVRLLPESIETAIAV